MVNKYYQKHNEKFWKKHLKDIKIILKNKRQKEVKDWYKNLSNESTKSEHMKKYSFKT